MNPLVHYVLNGVKQGRKAYPPIDARREDEPKTAAREAFEKPTVDIDLIKPLFDAAWYLDQNPDVAEAGLEPLAHFLSLGWREGRNPRPLFDTKFYLDQNPDVAVSGMNPLVHYLLYGGKEGRDPHPLFDTTFYLEQNPEVAASGMNPLVHYLLYGDREGRDAHPLFDVRFYLEQKLGSGRVRLGSARS